VRLAWVVQGDIAQPTGGYIYDRLVVEGMRAHGDEVHVIGIDPAPPHDIESQGLLVRIARARVETVVGDALCARELAPAFEQLASEMARVLLVHHLTSWEPEQAARQALHLREARAVVASDCLIATSQVTAARITSEYPSRAVEVALPGADRLPRHPRTAREGGPIELLFVGSIIARKRVSLLLDALERLADPRLSLTLLGDSGREPEYAGMIAARLAASPVLLAAVAAPGIVDDHALARWMARAHALALPSSLEGYGIVLTEALRAGLPVLASREAARAAGLEGSSAVLVFDDAPGLVGVLQRLLQEASLYRSLQRAAEGAVMPRWRETVITFRNVVKGLV
jgi:glycosyltransferase involved in cell wall biosynthesis